jgi:hypothetical protein
MAQTGYTPISLYYTTTAAGVPLAANLVSGELAINITDGKLFYKNAGNVVTLLASSSGSTGDVVGPASATDNALVRFDATTGKLIQNSIGILSDAGVLTGLTGITSSGTVTFSGLTAGRVIYTTTGGQLTNDANLLFDGTTLTANTLNLTNALGVAYGGTGQITAAAGFNALSPITTTGDLIIGNGTNSATRLAIGTNTYVLTSNGTTASWQAPTGGGGSPGGSDTQIQFNNSGAFGGSANFTYVSPTVTISSNNNYDALIAQTTSTTRTDRPKLVFKRTQTPAVGTVTSVAGNILFNSKTQVGAAIDFASIVATAQTSNSFTNDINPTLAFYTYNSTGGSSPVSYFTMDGRTTPTFVWGGYESGSVVVGVLDTTGFRGGNDGVPNLGESFARWNTVYATTGTINTSDRNEKQDIEELSDAERRVAARVKNLIRKFRFKDAVAKKGDAARIHFGVIAQDVQDAFAAEGLDASRYGLFCSDTFKTLNGKPVSKDKETGEYPEGSVDYTRLGVRYEELLSFVISSI